MFCVTAPLLPFDEISLLAGKRFVALFFSRSRARCQQFKQSEHIMMIGKSCEGSNEDFRNDSGTAVASIKPGPRPGWIALSSPSPCEAPAWTGESGGDFPLSPPGVVVIRGKDTTWRNENRPETYRNGVHVQHLNGRECFHGYHSAVEVHAARLRCARGRTRAGDGVIGCKQRFSMPDQSDHRNQQTRMGEKPITTK